jgi:hypothetical protein
MRQRDISWATATAGFVFLALMLAGEGFLFSQNGVESTVTETRSLHGIGWEPAMKALSRHAREWRQ